MDFRIATNAEDVKELGSRVFNYLDAIFEFLGVVNEEAAQVTVLRQKEQCGGPEAIAAIRTRSRTCCEKTYGVSAAAALLKMYHHRSSEVQTVTIPSSDVFILLEPGKEGSC